jgi:PAS domain S-box-containing protein
LPYTGFLQSTLGPLTDCGTIESLDDARRLHLLVESIVDYAIYLISVEGRVLTWNSGAERLKGYSAKEIVGQSFSNFYTPEDRDQGIPQKGLETAARTGRFEIEGWRVRKDGTRFWALAVIDAVRNDAGELIGFAKVTRDLTERQLTHRSLIESERRYLASSLAESFQELEEASYRSGSPLACFSDPIHLPHLKPNPLHTETNVAAALIRDCS